MGPGAEAGTTASVLMQIFELPFFRHCEPTADMTPRSRDATRPSFARNSRAFDDEGAGNAGCSMHPQLRVQKRKNARALTRSTGNKRHSLRNGFNSSSVVALVYRAC